MGERLTLKASDGFELNAYRAAPEGRPRAGVVVIQEVWGVNNWIRSVVDRWAAHGFLAVAPAMFDRIEPGYESENYGPDQFKVIGEMMQRFQHDTALLDVAAALEAVAGAGKVGITGYCFGGAVSWRAASAGLGLSAASGYYGGGVPNYIGLVPTVPIQMHFGDRDTGIPLEQVELLREQHPAADIHIYHAEHGFCNSDRPDRFDQGACARASARSLAFFETHLA